MTKDNSKPTRDRRSREAAERNELRSKRTSAQQYRTLEDRPGLSKRENEKLRIREGAATFSELLAPEEA
jgi:hypothetical protein